MAMAGAVVKVKEGGLDLDLVLVIVYSLKKKEKKKKKTPPQFHSASWWSEFSVCAWVGYL
jgi:hypothetical protein